MNQLSSFSGFRFACVGTYVPRQCGIATFTHDLCEALCDELKNPDACQVIALNDSPDCGPYPNRVRFEVRQEEAADYRLAADYINTRGVNLLLVQHEFGIFGGEAGAHLLAMLEDISVPVVTTMHTALREPNFAYRSVTRQLIGLSDRIVVMAQSAADILREEYSVPEEKLVLIPHGIPDMPFVDTAYYKDQFGAEGRKLLLTLGLLSPNKGIENAIRALPAIVRRHPEIVYVVLGATHPHIRRTRGEEYRHELQRLAEELGVLEYVQFHNRYVDLDELCEFLGAADVYITPYLSEEQVVSGTLAYALGAGKAIVSTPYWHAQELLADERGRLVPFNDPDAIAVQVNWLLDNEVERQAMRKRAYLHGREFVWREVARSYLDVFQKSRNHPVVTRHRPVVRSGAAATILHAVPELKLDHLRTLTDDVGILHHAHFAIPDRKFGYCTDDNARALIFALRAWRLTQSPELLMLANIYLAFLHDAYDEEAGRFRHRLSYDRRWSGEEGSEGSHGRALWGLGFAVTNAPIIGMRGAALDLFDRALRASEDFTSPQAWAYTIVGVHGYLRRYSGDSDARRVREQLAERLFERYGQNATDDWVWPENPVSSANGKLPHALLLAGQWLERWEMVDMGLRSLEWLLRVKTSSDDVLSVGGSDDQYNRNGARAVFDQQPAEMHALLEACLAAYDVTGEDRWLTRARRSFDWFLGKNPLRRVLYDYETGGCRDGLHPNGVNQNQGADSTLAWLLSLLAIRSLQTGETRPAERLPALVDQSETIPSGAVLTTQSATLQNC